MTKMYVAACAYVKGDAPRIYSGVARTGLNAIADAACSVCGSQTVSFVDDLVFEVVLAGERIVMPPAMLAHSRI